MNNNLTTVSIVQMFLTVIQTWMKTVTVNNTEFSFPCNQASENKKKVKLGAKFLSKRMIL